MRRHRSAALLVQTRLPVVLALIVFTIGLALPFAMAVLWSLVDPSHPWAYPAVLPPVLSFRRWIEIWTTSALPQALANSYLLAATVSVSTLLLALPTAYAFGRLQFPGKAAAQMLTLIPLVIPGFVGAIFFSALLVRFGVYSRFAGIALGHTVIFLPYAIRLLSLSFAMVRQDLIDAARDLGASPLTVFRTATLPVLKPGLLAALIIVFILSIEEFAISYIVGAPDFTTVPTILYSYLGYNFIRPNAAAISLILVVPNVLLMLIAERLLKSADPATITGKG
ncbi:putative spermidine/putrescine transport system permease protein [Rhizobium sp. RU35A]|uniref:ABC transporter permease n=1 Tax=Rhizobium sp. RU35A TaxID=1907414 RepID=UPI0009556F0E|nr:ABC transporter permease [Rhizobium sp. RU35A]SIQ37047.1 putative spermidine/putrescine transport system permease protein [Rhizobium sp. RU35A]